VLAWLQEGREVEDESGLVVETEGVRVVSSVGSVDAVGFRRVGVLVGDVVGVIVVGVTDKIGVDVGVVSSGVVHGERVGDEYEVVISLSGANKA